jgi:hypothetical protein
MRRVLNVAGVAMVFAAAPLFAADEKKKADTAAEPDVKKLSTVQEFAGKLVAVHPTDKTLTVEIEYEFLEPKYKNSVSKANAHLRRLYKEQQQLLRDQQKVLASRKPAQAAKHLQQLQQHAARFQRNSQKGQSEFFKISTARKDFVLEAMEDVKVRVAKLPAEFDAKGNPRKYTEAELKERKGPDPKLPGYASTFEELKIGQIVKLTLGKAKAEPAKGKEKEKAEESPKVTMIVVLQDTDLPTAIRVDKKK